jgi:hypothetical protein
VEARGRRSREGRLAKFSRIAGELKTDPGSSVPRFRCWLRQRLIAIWCSRGGGFYGLGYVIAFVYFEIEMFAGDLAESAGVTEFAGGQILELLFRLSILSFINVFQALFWPFFILERFQATGIMLLIGGYFVFERLLKPGIESVFPELAEYRAEKEAHKRAKQDRKREKQDAKQNKKRSKKQAGEDPSRNPNP